MFERFKQRSTQLERLDLGDYTAAEYARWQREMPLIHGVFGERRALSNSLIKDINDRKAPHVSIIDVGAGAGGILKMIREMAPEKEFAMTAAELSDEALKMVRDGSNESGIAPVKCSGLELPFADDSFDYAISTLTLHHLSDDEAAKLIGEMDRVSRKSFYVVDLNRHPLPYYAFRVIGPLLFQKFTCEDGALSILRSRTPDELIDIARRSGVSRPKVEHSRANRLILSRG